MSNPKSALAAINSIGEKVGDITLSEVSLSQAAILEAINSPVMAGVQSKDIRLADVLPTLFVLAHASSECRRMLAEKTFETSVFDWADRIPVADGAKLVQAMKRILMRIGDVAPQGMVGQEGHDPAQKKTETDGSRHSPRQ